MNKNYVGLGLIGFGTVGSGVVKILRQHTELIKRKIGVPCRLVQICDIDIKKSKFLGLPSNVSCTTRYQNILNNPDIDIVIELIGGYEPSRTIVCEALQHGKHVVTANKAILARYWDELFSLAHASKRLLYFEAAVGGGIPIIQVLNEGLAANRIEKIMGILNGTTNYILTKMSDEHIDFKKALSAAKKAGFAESDPRFDISGIDAAHKISILASLAIGAQVPLSQVYCEGIAHVLCEDIMIAQQQLNLSVKLLGIVKSHHKSIEVRVHPALIPATHPFSAVKNEYNAVFVHGDAVGDVMLYGKGAGKMAAASAVVSDIIFLARHVANGTAGLIPYVTYERNKSVNILPMKDIRSRYYIRFTTIDKPGVLAQIAGILSKSNVSIASVYQKEPEFRHRTIPIIIVTHYAREGDIQKSIKIIDKLSVVRAKTVMIRIEE